MRYSYHPRKYDMRYEDLDFDHDFDKDFDKDSNHDFDRNCPRPCPPPCPPSRHRELNFIIAQNVTGGARIASTNAQPIIFTTIVARHGTNIIFVPNTSDFLIVQPGLYEVSYNVTYSLAAQSPATIATVNTFLTLNTSTLIGGNLTSSLPSGEQLAHSSSTLINVTDATTLTPVVLRLNTITNRALTYTNASISINRVR